MNLPLFLARRLYASGDSQVKVSRPAVRIATMGVAAGLAVMIVTVSVVLGFKHTIRNKVVGFGGHLLVQNALTYSPTETYPVCIDDSMLSVLRGAPGVAGVGRFAVTQGILKTDHDFQGVAFKGVGPEYDLTFLKESLVEGEMPQFSDTATTYPLVISKTISNRMGVCVGDRVFAYFISQNDVRARRFTVKGIYNTSMKRFDDAVCLTDLYATHRLNGWFEGQCSGAEVNVSDFAQLDAACDRLLDEIGGRRDRYNNTFTVTTIQERYPQIFSWLSLLDINVWIILVLMVAVAGFTMISGLLIIMLERTQMIGTLKALGARNRQIRHTFLWLAVFIVWRGMLWGNVIGLAIVFLQQQTGLVRLDPDTYYVAEAPMELSLLYTLLINLATLTITTLALVLPSFLATRINPARTMHYD